MDQLVEAFRQRMAKEIQKRREDLSSGNAQTFDKYKHEAGVIRGLNMALGELDACLQSLRAPSREERKSATTRHGARG